MTLLSDFETVCAVTWACGAPVHYQGYDYVSVQIGTQCWFAENLRATAFANGDSITVPAVEINNDDWVASGGDLVFMRTHLLESDGGHYSWGAAIDERGLCPNGWHLSSNSDWYVLEEFIELEFIPGEWGWRGTNGGMALKSTSGWNNDGNGSDLYRFNGLPSGNTGNLGIAGFWWAPGTIGVHRESRHLAFDQGGIFRGNDAVYQTFSVRCVLD